MDLNTLLRGANPAVLALVAALVATACTKSSESPQITGSGGALPSATGNNGTANNTQSAASTGEGTLAPSEEKVRHGISTDPAPVVSGPVVASKPHVGRGPDAVNPTSELTSSSSDVLPRILSSARELRELNVSKIEGNSRMDAELRLEDARERVRLANYIVTNAHLIEGLASSRSEIYEALAEGKRLPEYEQELQLLSARLRP